LKCFTEGAVLMYSGIEFQIEVPETMNELQIIQCSVSVYKAENWKMI